MVENTGVGEVVEVGSCTVFQFFEPCENNVHTKPGLIHVPVSLSETDVFSSGCSLLAKYYKLQQDKTIENVSTYGATKAIKVNYKNIQIECVDSCRNNHQCRPTVFCMADS